MGMWNGPVNEHVTADLFVRAVFGEANSFHLQLAAMFETRDLEVESLIGKMLFLDRDLRIDCILATALQTLI